MDKHASLISTAKVRAGAEAEFSVWQAKHDAITARFPGFLSSDMVPPPRGRSEEPWTIILNFESREQLEVWQRSAERGAILGEVIPLLEGGTFGEAVQESQGPETEVTEVIFSRVQPGKADRYREWAGRIRAAQARFPGYRGMFLQPPRSDSPDGHWTTILRFDSSKHLEDWMNSEDRKALLTESKEFIESEELMRLATAFPGWVPLDPVTGEPPPNWKAAMLVLLGLFPIVMLEMKYLNLGRFGLHASLATFIGNVISVALTSFITMPLFVKWFEWWLFPKADKAFTTAKGSALLCGLFAIEVVALWKLLPW